MAQWASVVTMRRTGYLAQEPVFAPMPFALAVRPALRRDAGEAIHLQIGKVAGARSSGPLPTLLLRVGGLPFPKGFS